MIPTILHDDKNRFVLIKLKEKVPFEKEWQKGGYKHNDPKVVQHLKDNGNIGILTGKGLIIFDCDCQQAENIARQLPDTLVIGTSMINGYRKKHFYFKCNLTNKHVLNDHDKHLGEIQALGQQCLVPPSIHPKGWNYEILEDRDIAKVDTEVLLKTISPFITKNKTTSRTSTMIDESDPICLLIKENIKIPQVLKKYGFDTSKNPTKCLWHESEGGKCFSFNDELWNCFHCQSGGNIFHLVMKHEGVGFNQAKEILELLAKKNDEKMDSSTAFNKFFKFDGKKNRFVPKILGDYILKMDHFKTIIGNDKQIYIYKDGYYQNNGIEYIKNKCRNLLNEHCSVNRINETIAHIRDTTYINSNEINNPYMNLENGLFNPETFELIEHTHNIFTLHRIPIKYDKDEDCPEWKKHINIRAPGWIKDCLQEMFGYCLINKSVHEVAFALYGPKRTMKSTVLNILQELLGEKSITGFTLHQLTEDKHSKAHLFGKRANICAELSEGDLKNIYDFLRITSGDLITAGKKYEQEITFNPSTKLVFSCNSLPAPRSQNPAFFRRWILLNFNVTTKSNEVDSNIKNKFRNELPGILNWSLEGLKRLQEGKKFSYPLTDRDNEATYKKNSDSVDSFILDKITDDTDQGKITKREMYKEYINFCKLNDIIPRNQMSFGRAFLNKTGCGTGKLEGIPAYVGIRFKNSGLSQSKLL